MGKIKGPARLILPGDKGFDEERYKKLPWNSLRGMAGLEQKREAYIEIHGYILKDKRRDPVVTIWKNCEMEMTAGFRPVLPGPPIPFESVREARMKLASMHLSADDEKKIGLVALSPDPGLGEPMPNVLIGDKKSIEKM